MGLVKCGAAVTIGTTAAVVFEWTDKLMLAAMQPIEEVAFYTIAFGMVSLPLLLPRAINITFYPTVSTLQGAGDMEGLKRTTERVMRLTMMMMAYVPIGMIAIAPWIVELLYGEFFLPAVAPFVILSIWGLVRPVGLLAYSIPKGLGQPMVGAKAMVLTALLNVVLNLVLIPLYGLRGAAVATTTSYVIGFSYLTVIALRMVDARFPWVPVVKAVISAGIAGVVMFLLYAYISPEVDASGSVLNLLAVTVATGFAGLGIGHLVRTLGIPGSRVVCFAIQSLAGLKILRDRWLGWDKG
jgi:O-antigen/teichoic acid export membrane protein